MENKREKRKALSRRIHIPHDYLNFFAVLALFLNEYLSEHRILRPLGFALVPFLRRCGTRA